MAKKRKKSIKERLREWNPRIYGPWEDAADAELADFLGLKTRSQAKQVKMMYGGED